MTKILIIVALLAGTLGYLHFAKSRLSSQTSTSPNESVLKSLPDGIFSSLNGKPIKITSNGSKLILVHFWATWCGPCEVELPALLRFIENRPNLNAYLIAVNDDLTKVLKRQGVPVPRSTSPVWLLDNQNVHRDAFGTTKLPETYIFNENGKLLRKLIGPQDWGNSAILDTF